MVQRKTKHDNGLIAAGGGVLLGTSEQNLSEMKDEPCKNLVEEYSVREDLSAKALGQALAWLV